MSKILCKCGNVINLSGDIPNSQEYIFTSDKEFDLLTNPIDTETLYKNLKSFFECSNCKRLWFFWDGFKNKPISYLPEKDTSLESMHR